MKTSHITLFIVIFLAFSFSFCNHKNKTPNEESFIGEWYTIKGDLEAYSFLKDSTNFIFVGTQNYHPVVYGTWKIEKEKFVITMDNGTTDSYNFVLSNDTLTLNEGEQIYTRTEPLHVRYPEVRILVSLAGDFSSMNFSEPGPADLNWVFWDDSTQSFKSFYLKGYSISAATIISSGVLLEITNYLTEYGYEPDTLYLTEICKGFRDDNQIITVCTSKDTEAGIDLINIQITSGLIIK